MKATSERDYKKEALQLHTTFHNGVYQTLLNVINEIDDFIKDVEDEEAKADLTRIKEDVERAISQASDIVDILANMVSELHDKTLRLQGALEEARRK